MGSTARKDWGFEDAVAALEQETQRRTPVRPAPRPAAPAAGGMIRAGFLLTAAVAVMLIGLVALHVSILQKHREYSELVDEKNSLAAENAHLSGEVAALRSPARIEAIATGQLGMVSPKNIEYVYIGPDGARSDYARVDYPPGAAGGSPATP